jgi:putative Mn2+ efflux pump MntP
VFTLLLVALSVGLDNFGAATAIGVAGVDRTLRIRIAVVFGTFEAAMPVLGILLGNSVAHELGGSAKPFGGTLLGLVGAYAVVTDLVGTREPGKSATPSLRGLVLIGAALSVDNLVIGFALGASHTNLAVAALTIGTVSVALSLLGLEIGSRLGGRLGDRSELVGGIVLIAVGVAVGTGLL